MTKIIGESSRRTNAGFIKIKNLKHIEGQCQSNLVLSFSVINPAIKQADKKSKNSEPCFLIRFAMI